MKEGWVINTTCVLSQGWWFLALLWIHPGPASLSTVVGPCGGTFPTLPSHPWQPLTDDDRQHPHGLALPAVDLGPLAPMPRLRVPEVWVRHSLDPTVHPTLPRDASTSIGAALQ